jgi:hypothetical protein
MNRELELLVRPLEHLDRLAVAETIGVDVELPADRQERLPAKEILCEIDLAL